MKKKKNKIVILLMIIGILSTIYISYSYTNRLKIYENSYFSVEYDSTWKVVEESGLLELNHRKSDSVLNIQCKVISDNFSNTDLTNLVSEIVYSIEEQNEGYELIAVAEDISSKYEGFSYLYEKDMEQVLVNIYKKDSKLIIAYYEASSEYYDIVLDSVDSILNSLNIKQ